MMTTFLIKRTFAITGRQSIVFEGAIIEGTISKGQKLRLNSTDQHPAFELIISGVESVDHISSGTSNTALIAKIESGDILNNLLNFGIKNERCTIK